MSKTRVVHINDNVPGAVYIGRANGRKGLKASMFANPFKVGKDGDLATVIAKYRKYQDYSPAELRTLAGKPLACWCRHDGEERTDDNACHGDVLVEMIEALGLDEGGA